MVRKMNMSDKNIGQQLRDLFDVYKRNLGLYFSSKSIKDQYIEIISKLPSEKEETVFIEKVSAICSLDFYGDEKEIISMIDLGKIEKYGVSKFIERGGIPLKNGGILTYNPFLEFYGSVYLTTRSILLRIYDFLKKTYSFNIASDVDIETIDIEKYLTEILQDAYTQKVSDIHIEYDPVKQVSITRFRKDGILEKYRENGSLTFHEILANKIFEISGINTNDFIRMHDKRIVFEIFQKQIPIRVSVVPVNVEGERKVSNIVLRILSGNIGINNPDFISLGYFEDDVEEIEKMISLPFGLVVVCGPTGSGKTTLLYSMLIKKSQSPVKIVTIEDPVEVPLGNNITQVEVREGKGDDKDNITFSSAIRSFLRHDPDVMLIGEIRDTETAIECIRASITGHLVFTTLHTNTSVGVFPRLIDLGVSSYMIADALKYVISQRLVRKLCDNCKIKINTADSKQINKYFRMDIDEFEYKYKKFMNQSIYVANENGCPACIGGYKGRTVIYEILKINENIIDYLIAGKFLSYKDAFMGQEDKSFSSIAYKKIIAGETSIKEVERYIIL